MPLKTLWPHPCGLCVQQTSYFRRLSHNHPLAPIEFLWEDKVRLKPGVDTSCILNTPTRKCHLKCILSLRITLNLHSQAELGSFFKVTSTIGKSSRAWLLALDTGFMTFIPSEAPADWLSWGPDSSSPHSQWHVCGSPLSDLQNCVFHSISSDCCSNSGPYSQAGFVNPIVTLRAGAICTHP